MTVLQDLTFDGVRQIIKAVFNIARDLPFCNRKVKAMSRIATDWAWKQKSISATQKIVLLSLADRHNPDTGDCFPSIGRLADECCMGESSVKRSLNELSSLSLITKVERRNVSGRNTSNQYQLHLDNCVQLVGVQPEPLVGSTVNPEPKLKKQEPDTAYLGEDAIDAFLDEPTPRDNSKDFWDEAVGMMMAMGVVEVTARPFIGRMLGWTKGDMKEALRVIDEALQAGTNNPITYIAAIYTKKGNNRIEKKKDTDELFAKLKEASDARKRQWAEEEAALNAGGSDDQDHGVLSQQHDQGPNDLQPDADKPVGKVSGRRVAEIMRPAGGHLGEM